MNNSMTLSNNWWIVCAVSLSFAARFGSCKRQIEDGAQSELFIFNELCALKDEQGPCKAIKERFFFNVNKGICELFEYGGCGGNANNFETSEACEETCVVSDDKSPCHLAEAPGPCRGLLTRYFFDSQSQHCKQFFYGGCFGNANNFRSMSECQAKCQNPAKPTEAPELHPLSGVVQPSGELSELQVQEDDTNQEPKELNPSELCSSPVDKGTCEGAEKRFAFNPKTNRCQMFQYSGCGGNENNFTKRKDCISKCKSNGKRMIRIRKKNMNIIANRSV